MLTNKGQKTQDYVFYNNFWNGDGKAGANFDHPDKTITLKAGETKHVPLDTKFKGRVQRGTQQPSTWAEFQLEASDDHKAHGDISVQRGYDGAATIRSTDPGSNLMGGFTNDAFIDAPKDAFRNKEDGTKALAPTEPDWNGPGNTAAIAHLNKVVTQQKAYILGGTGVPDIASANKCLAVDFY